MVNAYIGADSLIYFEKKNNYVKEVINMQKHEQIETTNAKLTLKEIKDTLIRDCTGVESVTIVVHPLTLCKWDGIIWNTKSRGLYKCNDTIIHLILVES